MALPPPEIVLTLPGFPDPVVAIAACRAGALGVLDLEYERSTARAADALRKLQQHARAGFGVKLDPSAEAFTRAIISALPHETQFAILTGNDPAAIASTARYLADRGVAFLLEALSEDDAGLARELGAAGVIAKGLEAGGRTGSDTTFILIQRILASMEKTREKTRPLPVWAQGGIGSHTAAACIQAGAAGVVLDWQLALTREASASRALPEKLRDRIRAMDGSETACLGETLGASTRLFLRPGVAAADKLARVEADLIAAGPGPDAAKTFREAVLAAAGAEDPEKRAGLTGQDAAFAARLAARHL
ncbi:MAG: nitronate monooxygenase, partial [Deltaproteobacteria bacterium]|nr:nitronate monooxygenase [Deltaproteobacteria bacterium]